MTYNQNSNSNGKHVNNIVNENTESIKSVVKNILGISTDLPINEILELLEQIYIDTSKEKKKNELVKRYLEEIKFIVKSPDNIIIFKNNKEKNFSNILKSDVKTKTYNTVKDDNLSPTLNAYYNCDKNRNILSDKEAATLKAIKIDNNFDLGDENMGNYINKGKNSFKDRDNNKDYDNLSNSSQSGNKYENNSDQNTPFLRKKRKYSIKKKDIKKTARSTKKNPNRHGNKSDSPNDEDCNKVYCIPDCHFSRKYNRDCDKNELTMIGCDACDQWYHPLCLGMTNEELNNNINIEWHCDECKNNKKIHKL